MARCRSCDARIIWAVTERGRRHPIDWWPDPEGHVVLRYGTGDEPPVALFGVPHDAYPGEPYHTSHFATCPNADEWRRRS